MLLALLLFADTIVEVPKQVPAPALIVLHGDRESAATAAARWRAAVRERGWILVAPDAPGETRSWWQWDGDAAVVTGLVKELAPTKVYIAGWSGGASYLGAHAAKLGIAGVVIHGGGMPPRDGVCPAHPLPAYFLVGDANPLHHLAVALRAYFAACHDDVVWDLVHRGDHDAEARALTKAKALLILDWLSAHGS